MHYHFISKAGWKAIANINNTLEEQTAVLEKSYKVELDMCYNQTTTALSGLVQALEVQRQVLESLGKSEQAQVAAQLAGLGAESLAR